MKAAIRADGRRQAGLGHLGRCLALAQALRHKHDIVPVFLIDDEGGAAWVRERGFAAERVREDRWDLLIADSYRFTAADRRALRQSAGTLLCVDDLGSLNGPCDWILNSGVRAHSVSYDRARAAGFLLGPKFHPMREEFWKGPPPALAKDEVENVLIAMGGGGMEAGLLEAVVRAASRALPRADLHVVAGPLAEDEPDWTLPRVTWHRSPENMKTIMEGCDLAVSGGGQTLYELAFVGVPAVALALAENQRDNLRGFADAGTLLDAGAARGRDLPARLGARLKKAASDAALRQRMAVSGRALLDGLGALRVAQAVVGTGG